MARTDLFLPRTDKRFSIHSCPIEKVISSAEHLD